MYKSLVELLSPTDALEIHTHMVTGIYLKAQKFFDTEDKIMILARAGFDISASLTKSAV